MKSKIVNLKYGAKLIHSYVSDVEGVFIKFIFKSGCLNDPKGKSGLAHFCEHALESFSTNLYSRKEREEKFSELNYLNASTSSHNVTFVLQTTNAKIEKDFEYLTHPFCNLKYEKEDFEKEYKIISDEIKTRLKANRDKCRQLIYKKVQKAKEYHNVHVSPAGDMESLSKIKLRDLKWFIENYFTLNNLTIVISGKLTLRKAMKLINKYIYKNIKQVGIKGYDFEDYKGFYSPRLIVDKAVEEGKSILKISYAYKELEKFVKLKDVCVTNFLGNCIDEKAFQFFRGDKNLCYYCRATIGQGDKYEIFTFDIECQDENIMKILEVYKDFVANIKEQIDEELLNKSREKYNEWESFDRDSLRIISNSKYGQFCLYNRLYDRKALRKERDKVTLKDLQDELDLILQAKPYITIVSNVEELKNFNYNKYVNKK